MIKEDNSYEFTQTFMTPQGQTHVFFWRPVYIERLGQSVKEITGLLMNHDHSEGTFIHPNGTTVRQQIVTEWEFLLINDIHAYQKQGNADGLTIRIQFDLIKHAEIRS